MLSLRDSQIALSAAVRSDDPGDLAHLVRGDGIPPERRIRIYHNNYRLGALAAMQATFPVVERLGGADWFAQSVAHYQERHPSQSGDLQNLGADYPRFLLAELATTDYLYFADVAALEWSYQLVLTAEECAPVDIASLYAIAPRDYEALRFVPRPAVHLVESAYPVRAIWLANQSSASGDETIRLDAGGSRVLLNRRGNQVEMHDLTPGNFELLRQFQLGTPLGAAAAAAAAQAANYDLTTGLRELLGFEAIAAILHGEAA